MYSLETGTSSEKNVARKGFPRCSAACSMVSATVGMLRVRSRARQTDTEAFRSAGELVEPVGVRVLADCEAQGIMFVPYFPLASGQLASYDELTGPAQRLDATPAQVALAWLLRRSPATVVIAGTTNPDHLHANITAAEVATNLTDAEVDRLTGLVDESPAVLDQPRHSTLDVQRIVATTGPDR